MSESTRAELLRQRIRDVQDLAAELEVDARIGIHADGDVPSGLGPVARLHSFESECAGTISECESFEFLEYEHDGRTAVSVIVTRRTRPAKADV